MNMLKQKNHLMLRYSMIAVLLSIVFHLLNRQFDVLHDWMHHGMASSAYIVIDEDVFGTALNTLFVVPVLLLIAAFVLYRRNREHRWIPLLNTLTLTLSSVSLIAGGGGMVELHFSIFMTVAVIAYYEQIKLISISTIIFALQHIIGFLWLPEIVFGYSSYSFGMLFIHALFLLLTSAATIRQIYLKQLVLAAIEAEKQAKDTQLQGLVATAEELSTELEDRAHKMDEQSESHVQTSQEMAQSFNEVSAGLDKQSQAISKVYEELNKVEGLVEQNTEAFDILNEHRQQNVALAIASNEALSQLTEHIEHVSETFQHTTQAAQNFSLATKRIDEAMQFIMDITTQTKLLALNASIEAARAGEHGRGFAVVASEIRALSDQSRQAAEDIQEVLASVVHESEHIAQLMLEGEHDTRRTVELSHVAVSQYAEMGKASEEMGHIITDLSQSAHRLQQNFERMHEDMMSMAAITEQGVASIEQLFAASRQQQGVITKLDEEIDLVAQLAYRLKQQFVVS